MDKELLQRVVQQNCWTGQEIEFSVSQDEYGLNIEIYKARKDSRIRDLMAKLSVDYLIEEMRNKVVETIEVRLYSGPSDERPSWVDPENGERHNSAITLVEDVRNWQEK